MKDGDPKPQPERFKQMARELGCDEDEDAFKEKLRQVIRHKPTGAEKPVEEKG